MRYNFAVAALVLASASISFGATQTINFSQGGGDFLQLQSSNGDILTASNNATLFFGVFDTVPTNTSTASEIADAFTSLGIPRQDINQFGLFPDNAFYGDPSNAPFTNARAYVVISNNPDMAQATEFAIMTNTSDNDWLLSNGAVPSVTSIDLEEDIFDKEGNGGVMIFGSRIGTPNDSVPDAIRLEAVAVPEPSSAALLGLGALAFAFRRRK